MSMTERGGSLQRPRDKSPKTIIESFNKNAERETQRETHIKGETHKEREKERKRESGLVL
jgi:hypothetical protein